MQPKSITVYLNHEPREWRVHPNDLLLNVLREHEALTGTKYGCGIGECGACTVHIDGEPVLSCLTLAIACEDKSILTIEGLARDGKLDAVQTAFLDHSAFQCGFCTSDMILMTRALLNEIPNPTEEQVRDYLRGNLCRCTGYASIVRAALGAATQEANAIGAADA
ncbi:MAG: (2Fe-2S)-binding protein [Anaerolineae bacterium]|nr:(2Fe-2S)-binding protein [Anaerolineae bacterium]